MGCRAGTRRASVAFAIAALGAGCETDGRIDWRGGEWREQVWRTYAPMGQNNPGFPAHGFAPTVALESTLYVLGGGASCASPITNVAWSRLGNNNGDQGRSVLPLPAARAHGGGVVLDGQIYFLGGCEGNAAKAETYAFDFVSNLWMTRAPMTRPRYGFASAVLDGKIYVAGGVPIGTEALVASLSKPTPAMGDRFGVSVAMAGDRVVVGADEDGTTGSQSGAAYLFDASTGALIDLLDNPTPAAADQFGTSVAVANGVVVVGAVFDDAGAAEAGSAHLFDASTGAFLRTLANPTPAIGDNFGISVAAAAGFVAVGAFADDAGAANGGSAYVFDPSTGTLLRTLVNPTPAADDRFGISVAAAGGVVVVGAYLDDDAGAVDAGAAYVFDAASGSLVWTLDNPTPAANDYFGLSVATTGGRVVVGAYGDDTGATDAGAAYVFDASTGALLRTLLNPAPSNGDFFGTSVAVAGNRAVVGADFDDAGAADGGSAYVFDVTTGALVRTLAKPDPVDGDGFGHSVGASATLAVVGAYLDDVSATDAGSAHVFDVSDDAPDPQNVEVYDPDTDTWATLPPIPTARLDATGAGLGGKFFVIGGQSADGSVFHDDVDIFDPDTGVWTTGASMTTARAGGGAALEGRIIVVAGQGPEGPTDVVEIYDPYLDEWIDGPVAPTPRSFVHPAVIRSNLYTVGGIGDAGAALFDVEGLIPVDIAGRESPPLGWTDTLVGGGSGGTGPTSGPNDDGGGCGCAIRDNGHPRWAIHFLLAAAAFATARFRKRVSSGS